MAQSGSEPSGSESQRIMAQSGSEPSGYESVETQESGTRLKIQLNEYGQPIGDASTQFATFVGRMTRTHCPPAYESWKIVPVSIKEKIWCFVSDKYDVPISQRKMVLTKANVAWKQWKHDLRTVYDKYETDAKRMKYRPKNVKGDDWKAFIKMCSTEEDKARREKGKACRKMMKNPHTTGRRGSAKMAEELKKQSSSGTVTRTQIYLASHTKKDGTSLGTQIDEIKRLVLADPCIGEKDLDNDPVATVCGRDGRGNVRGMGTGVSKTSIQASAPAREITQQEKRARESIQSQVDMLRYELDEERRARKILEEKVNLLSSLAPPKETFISTSVDQFDSSDVVEILLNLSAPSPSLS